MAEALTLCSQAWKDCPPEPSPLAWPCSGPATLPPNNTPRSATGCLLFRRKRRTTRSCALAEVRFHQQRLSEVIALNQEMLRRDPKDALAQNNLAWLLALHEGKGQEALDMIQQAIKTAGPTMPLLDTRAVIFIALGQSTSAIRDLEDVVAEAPSANRLFHLARAYFVAGQRDAALSFLAACARRGIKAGPRRSPGTARL